MNTLLLRIISISTDSQVSAISSSQILFLIFSYVVAYFHLENGLNISPYMSHLDRDDLCCVQAFGGGKKWQARRNLLHRAPHLPERSVTALGASLTTSSSSPPTAYVSPFMQSLLLSRKSKIYQRHCITFGKFDQNRIE